MSIEPDDADPSDGDLSQWCYVRDTSEEIGRAIWELFDDPSERDRVWDDGTDDEQARVMVRAWELSSEVELYWGENRHTRQQPEPVPEAPTELEQAMTDMLSRAIDTASARGQQTGRVQGLQEATALIMAALTESRRARNYESRRAQRNNREGNAVDLDDALKQRDRHMGAIDALLMLAKRVNTRAGEALSDAQRRLAAEKSEESKG